MQRTRVHGHYANDCLKIWLRSTSLEMANHLPHVSERAWSHSGQTFSESHAHRHTFGSSAYRVNHHTTSPVNLLMGHTSSQLIFIMLHYVFPSTIKNTSKSLLETKQPVRKKTNSKGYTMPDAHGPQLSALCC